MTTYTQEFKSLAEFYEYICNTPLNDTFRWAQCSSTKTDSSFSKTRSFDDACEMFKNGWTEMAQQLTQKLRVANKQTEMVQKRKMINSVCGFQPIVPLYLSGVPTNMVQQIMVATKQKVVNITKSISYNASTSAERIIEESIKAMQLVQKVEAMGCRVNLNIALGTCAGGREIVSKIRIKSAGEKLNISKLAFPLVHPSMLRRLYFRYVEVNPNVTTAYKCGYGCAITADRLKQLYPNEIIIPAIMDKCDVNKIDTLEQLKASFN